MANPRYTAGGTIRTCRAVKADPTADFTVLEADANELCVGISQEGPYDAPGLSGATANAAIAGQQLRVYGPGEECLAEIGATDVTAGELLKSDNDGLLLPIATTGTTVQIYVARALETATETGAKVRVQVEIGHVRPALT